MWLSDGPRDRNIALAYKILSISLIVTALAFAISRFDISLSLIRFLDNLHWTTTYSAAAALGWIGVRMAQTEDRPIRLWFTIGLTLYAVGQILWDVQVAVGWNPFPGPSDLFFICLGPCFAVGLYLALRSKTAHGMMRSAMLDTSALSVAIICLTLALYLPYRGSTNAFTLVVMVTYPVVLLTAACIGIMLVLNMHLGTDRRWAFLLLPLMADGAIWMHWNALTLDSALSDGTFFNLSFSVVSLALGYGAMIWHIDKSKDETRQRWCEGVLLLLPLILVIVALTSALLAWALPGVTTAVKISIFLGAISVLVLATLRQSLLLSERTRVLDVERLASESSRRYKALFEATIDSILLFDGEAFVDCNPSALSMFGCRREDILGSSPIKFSPELQPDGTPSSVKARGIIESAFQGTAQIFEWRHCRFNRTPFDAQIVLNRIELDGKFLLQGVIRDITEVRILEQQLQQSRKMESLGTLAGGIAHDFNNILAIIIGYCSALQEGAFSTDKMRQSIGFIETAAKRGAALVRQLLTFAHKTEVKKSPVQVNELVKDLSNLMRETFPKTISIEIKLDETLPEIFSDSTQLHQVLLNLCINARDAMPTGGKLCINSSISNSTAVPSLSKDTGFERYICIEISDSGKGMDQATSQRIFEPFFTTKQLGQGTGLGLSVAFGIVKHHGGTIEVESELNVGTSFKVYFPVPLSMPSSSEKSSLQEAPISLHGMGTVLVVEDERVLHDLLVAELQMRGYSVLSAFDGEEALEKFKQHSQRINLILTDLGLPKRSGREVVTLLRKINSSVKIIVASGYIEPDVKSALDSVGIDGWIHKPYTISELLLKVSQILKTNTP